MSVGRPEKMFNDTSRFTSFCIQITCCSCPCLCLWRPAITHNLMPDFFLFFLCAYLLTFSVFFSFPFYRFIFPSFKSFFLFHFNCPIFIFFFFFMLIFLYFFFICLVFLFWFSFFFFTLVYLFVLLIYSYSYSYYYHHQFELFICCLDFSIWIFFCKFLFLQVSVYFIMRNYLVTVIHWVFLDRQQLLYKVFYFMVS